MKQGGRSFHGNDRFNLGRGGRETGLGIAALEVYCPGQRDHAGFRGGRHRERNRNRYQAGINQQRLWGVRQLHQFRRGVTHGAELDARHGLGRENSRDVRRVVGLVRVDMIFCADAQSHNQYPLAAARNGCRLDGGMGRGDFGRAELGVCGQRSSKSRERQRQNEFVHSVNNCFTRRESSF